MRIDEQSGKIIYLKFKTFGCGSTMASSNFMTEHGEADGNSIEDVDEDEEMVQDNTHDNPSNSHNNLNNSHNNDSDSDDEIHLVL
ncbi:1915_t:CDS:2 [Entrophospora sp. SA101]|nr:1915_t:CDS:2 [Entrophospora sp. SA101]